MDGLGCVCLWGWEGVGGVVIVSKWDICEVRVFGRSLLGMWLFDFLCEGYLVFDLFFVFGVGWLRYMGF